MIDTYRSLTERCRTQQEEIATIRPRQITVNLSDADCERISVLAGSCGVTVSDLLENFIGDLVYGTYSNGSDEREYANKWLERTWIPYNGTWQESTSLLYHLLNNSESVDLFLDAWNEKCNFEQHPEDYEEEMATGDDFDWWTDRIEYALQGWKRDDSVSFDDEIKACEQWLSDFKKLLGYRDLEELELLDQNCKELLSHDCGGNDNGESET
jgi:hypothetical protein